MGPALILKGIGSHCKGSVLIILWKKRLGLAHFPLVLPLCLARLNSESSLGPELYAGINWAGPVVRGKPFGDDRGLTGRPLWIIF